MGCFSSRVEAPTEELPGPPAAEHDAPTTADTAAPTQPAAALPSAADLGVSEEKLELWRKHGGGDLERVLASGAVDLLDAQWIISHAEAGGVLNHRQALPKEAFLSLADLVEATGDLDVDDDDEFRAVAGEDEAARVRLGLNEPRKRLVAFNSVLPPRGVL